MTAPDLPMPAVGGSYIRLPDGTLQPRDDAAETERASDPKPAKRAAKAPETEG